MKPSLFILPCSGANKLTPSCGAPHACPPPFPATGRAARPTGEPTAWPSPARLLGTVSLIWVWDCITATSWTFLRDTRCYEEEGLVHHELLNGLVPRVLFLFICVKLFWHRPSHMDISLILVVTVRVNKVFCTACLCMFTFSSCLVW